MNITRKLRLQLWLQRGVFTLLLAAAVVLLALLARDYHKSWDVTQNARSTLSRASLDTLRQLKGPVSVTAYISQRDARLGDLRAAIQNFFTRYQRAKPDLTLKFIDAREQPKLAAAAGIQIDGEMVVEYGKRSEHLSTLNEQEVTNLLLRLARSSERQVMALDGHGERRLDGKANHDLGDFGRQLASRGFRVNSVNLALAQEVPANASVLLIANPQVDLQEAEVAKLKRFVDRGGNLFWLIDQEPLHGLQALVEMLGLVLAPGVVVDPTAVQFNAAPTMAVATAYGDHPITREFRMNAVFPFARQVGTVESGDWKALPLIEVAPRGWIETGALDQNIVFDKKRDTPGPVTIGVALEREVEDRRQRIVAIGSGHFLANTYLGNGGNLELGLHIVNWLAGDDKLVSIAPRVTVDPGLNLSRASLMLMAFGFLAVIPLASCAAGAYLWWRRRRL